MNDKVSIVIPTRNRRDLLRQSVRSARAQTWPDVELLLVDEASDDGTGEMVAAEFPGVRIVRHDVPRGPGGARNAGVAATDGKWVLFLDDDDLLHERHVESLVRAAHGLTGGNEIVSGRWRRFTIADSAVRLGPVICAPQQRRGIEILAEALEPNGEGTICCHSVLWPRSVFADVLWDEQLSTNGDVDFVGRAVLSGRAVVGRPVGMAYYRSHPGDRVAGVTSVRGLLSSARYRLKWSRLLLSHPEREACATAMRNGLMALMIELSGVPEADPLMSQLQEAYRLWGGRGHYLSVPPRHPLKRFVAEGTLRLGGPAALNWLLKQTQRRGGPALPVAGHDLPQAGLDDADVAAIRSVE